MRRFVGVLVFVAAAAAAAPAQGSEIRLGSVTVSVQECEYPVGPEDGAGQCRDGVKTPVASTYKTCDHSSVDDSYPVTESCTDQTTVAGYTVSREDCSSYWYQTYPGASGTDCTSSTAAGVGSVRVTCEGTYHEYWGEEHEHSDTDTCSVKAGSTEVVLVTCETPSDNLLSSELPAIPECRPAP